MRQSMADQLSLVGGPLTATTTVVVALDRAVLGGGGVGVRDDPSYRIKAVISFLEIPDPFKQC